MIFYLAFRKRLNDKSLRVIFFLLIIGMCNDVYGIYLIWNRVGNFFNYNLFILIESLLLYYFFSLIIDSPFVKKILLILGFTFSIIWIFFYVKFQNTAYYNACLNIENISILALCNYYYYEKIIKKNSHYIYTEPRFWIVTAYLIYIAGTFFLVLYIPSLNTEDQEKFYVLNYLFTIIRTILLSVAMFMQPSDQQFSEILNQKRKS